MPDAALASAIEQLPYPAALVDPMKTGAPVVMANRLLCDAIGTDPVGLTRADLATQVEGVLIITRGEAHSTVLQWNEHAGLIARDSIQRLLRGATFEEAVQWVLTTLEGMMPDVRVGFLIRRSPQDSLEWYCNGLPMELKRDFLRECETCWDAPEDRDTLAKGPEAADVGIPYGWRGVWAASGYDSKGIRTSKLLLLTPEPVPHCPIDCYSANVLAQALVLLVRLNEYRKEVERHHDELAERLSAELTRKFIRASSLDLRQPLQALVSGLDLLAMEVKPETKPILDQMLNSVTRTREILDGLLDLERIEEGQMIPHRRNLALAGMVEMAAREYRPMAQTKGIDLHIESTDLWVTTDAMLTIRLLENLISNAVRYTARGAVHIGFESKNDGRTVRVNVTDTAGGFADRTWLTPFPRHAEASEWTGPERRTPKTSTASTRAERSGLGLAIIQAFGAILETPIYATSRPKLGTVFSFELPMAEPEVREPVSRAGHDKPLCLLYVDPDPQVLVLTSQALEREGIAGHGFTDPIDAIDAAAKINPDVLLTAHRFKEMAGLELIMAIRSKLGRSLPAVILTGDIAVATRDQRRFVQSRIIRKPARPAELAMVIREAAAGVMNELPWHPLE